MTSEPDNISSKLSFEGDAAVLINKGSIELDAKKAGSGDGFNFKKNKESFKESDATSTDNYMQFAKQLQKCDQGDTHSARVSLAKRRGSKDSKDVDSIDGDIEGGNKYKPRGTGDEMNVNSMRNMGETSGPAVFKTDNLAYQHIRQYNIMMEETQTAKITDEESPWENFSKSKVSLSRISPHPNLELIQTKHDNVSGDDCNPYELPDVIKRMDRPPQLMEDFSDMTEEFQSYKRRVMSNQNSTKNEKLIDLKPFGGAIEKPRTFTDQLRSVGATPIEHSDPDPQSPNSLIRFGRPKPQIVRDRLSECTKNNKNDQIEDDVDFYEGIDFP